MHQGRLVEIAELQTAFMEGCMVPRMQASATKTCPAAYVSTSDTFKTAVLRPSLTRSALEPVCIARAPAFKHAAEEPARKSREQRRRVTWAPKMACAPEHKKEAPRMVVPSAATLVAESRAWSPTELTPLFVALQ